jgi:hypothetical protein
MAKIEENDTFKNFLILNFFFTGILMGLECIAFPRRKICIMSAVVFNFYMLITFVLNFQALILFSKILQIYIV